MAKEKITSIFQKSPPWLFERIENTEHDKALDELAFRNMHGPQVWWRETIDRKRDWFDILRAFRKREGFLHHLSEGFQFMSDLDIADRAANGLMTNLIFDNRDNKVNSRFGVILNYAFNNPKHSDHNHPHNRRVERYSETIVLRTNELRHDQSIRIWLDSLLLYDRFHDIDQLYSKQVNEFRPGTVKDPKEGHGLAAAVMMLLLHTRYAKERRVSIHEAWKKCAGAAAMMMIHDDPNEFFNRLRAKVSAAEIIVGIDSKEEQISTLVDAFKNSKVDIFTLTPSQLILMLKSIKGDVEGYGLPRDMEEEYEQELTTQLNNHDLLLKDFTQEQRESFNHTAEVALLADLIDMNIPAEESHFRMLKVERSINRHYMTTNPNMKEVMNKVFHGDGEFKDDPDHSDILRALWQAVHVTQIGNIDTHKSPVRNSPYVQKLSKDAAVSSVIAIGHIGNRLMRKDFSIVDEVYQRRKEVLLEKALRWLNVILPRTLMQEDVINFVNSQDKELGERLKTAIFSLDKEKETIKSNLNTKISQPYSDQVINNFNHLINSVLKKLYKDYNISWFKKKLYERMVRSHQNPKTVPFETYDSLGTYPPRVLVEPIGIMTFAQLRAIVEGYIH